MSTTRTTASRASPIRWGRRRSTSTTASAIRYDANGNVVETIRYMKPLTGAIDPKTLPVPAASEDDRHTKFEYDKVNRLVKQTDPLGGIATMTYDGVGNM